jgi:protein O-GlcNAc transferase
VALDTLGWYNGHSTTADLLWAGVPVLTSPGETFASRVAASLVSAAGLHELVAASPADYVDCAVALANDRERTRALRLRLRDGRASAPFFDTPRLVRGLESAYEAMVAAATGPPT